MKPDECLRASAKLDRFPGHAIKPRISAATTGAGNSSVFRHGLCAPDSHTFRRNAASAFSSGSKRPEVAAEFELFSADGLRRVLRAEFTDRLAASCSSSPDSCSNTRKSV